MPFLYIGRPARVSDEGNSLIDVAPTILTLLDIDIPKEMTGKPLITIE